MLDSQQTGLWDADLGLSVLGEAELAQEWGVEREETGLC